MPWQILILLHSLLAGYRMTIIRKIGLNSKDISQYASVISYVCVFSLGLIVALISDSPIDHSSAWDMKWFLLIGGLLLSLANILTFKLLRLVNASVAVLLTLLNSLVLVLFATLFGGESLSRWQVLGCASILAAVLLAEIVQIIQKKKRKKSKNSPRILVSLGIALLISVPFALGILNEKYLLSQMPLTTYLIYGWGSQLVASLCIAGFTYRKNKKIPISSSAKKLVWLSGLLLAFGGLLFVLTLNQSKSSILSTVASSSKVISAVVFSYIFLHERDGLLLKAGSVALSGVGFFLLLR